MFGCWPGRCSHAVTVVAGQRHHRPVGLAVRAVPADHDAPPGRLLAGLLASLQGGQRGLGRLLQLDRGEPPGAADPAIAAQDRGRLPDLARPSAGPVDVVGHVVLHSRGHATSWPITGGQATTGRRVGGGRPLRRMRRRLYVSPMHSVDPTTESMIRSVLAYAENRLRLDPVPLDQGSRDPAELDAALKGLPSADPHNPDQVLGVYTSVIAPAVISADSPRFLGFIPAAPTKASLLFDMLVSCASIQGISWLEAAGAIHAENTVLRLIADRAGMPETAGGCFVSGGSAGNLSALVVAREVAKRKAGPGGGRAALAGGGQRGRPLLDRQRAADLRDGRAGGARRGSPADRRGRCGRRSAPTATRAHWPRSWPPRGPRTRASSTTWPARPRWRASTACGSTWTAPTAGPACSRRASGTSTPASSTPTRSSWTRTSGCSRPFDCAALLYRDPSVARSVHKQDASYLDVIHDRPGEWNPTDYAYHLTRRARGLPLWFSLSVHGVDAYTEAIETAIELARQTADEIRARDHLELIREPELGVVLFRRRGWDSGQYTAWADQLLQDQVAFIPPSAWEGETVARFAFLHPHTPMDLVREILDRMDVTRLVPGGSAGVGRGQPSGRILASGPGPRRRRRTGRRSGAGQGRAPARPRRFPAGPGQVR